MLRCRKPNLVAASQGELPSADRQQNCNCENKWGSKRALRHHNVLCSTRRQLPVQLSVVPHFVVEFATARVRTIGFHSKRDHARFPRVSLLTVLYRLSHCCQNSDALVPSRRRKTRSRAASTRELPGGFLDKILPA